MENAKLAELREGMDVEGFYAVQEANLLTTAQGKTYIRMTLSDASGALTANMWDATPEIFSSFAAGGVVKVRAAVESYRGALQLKVGAIRPAHESEYDSSSFVPSTPADVAQLTEQLFAAVNSVADPDYAALLHAFFDDAELVDKFRRAPAAMKNHHAYLGGLLEHTMSLVRIADAFCAAVATPLNRDLLLAGTLLHDIGKIDELSAAATIEYTDSGRLIGHLAIGALMTAERAAALPDFPEEKKNLLIHMILSHHGKREYGSPVLPAIPEALALHHIDNLDAKTVAARRTIDEDPGEDRLWTDRSWMLETQLYKGSLPRPAQKSADQKPRAESGKPAPAKKSGTGRLF